MALRFERVQIRHYSIEDGKRIKHEKKNHTTIWFIEIELHLQNVKKIHPKRKKNNSNENISYCIEYKHNLTSEQAKKNPGKFQTRQVQMFACMKHITKWKIGRY